ncbi:MAG: membrane protein insertion efficiency factor YidD, partial [Spirochaeta sp.]
MQDNFLSRLQKFLRMLWVIPIRFYQLVVSPWLPPSCIYSPTCSSYAQKAILQHGILAGTAIAVLRVGRCVGGLYEGGPDPVPSEISWRSIFSEYR